MSKLLAQARLQACRRWPFASHAILSMVPVQRPGLGTLAVDQHWRLYYDESALERFGADQSSGVILHELDHLLKRHHKRGKSIVGNDSAKWELWNYATDASINGSLRAEGVPLPEGVVYPENFDLPVGLSAEEYFRKLSDNQENQDGDSNETSDDSQGDEEPDSDAGSSTGNEGSDNQDDEGTSDGTDASAGDVGGDTEETATEPQPIGTSGSCSDGQQRPWELGSPDEENPGLDEADQEQLVHVTAKNVLERECGKGTGGHRRWAEDNLVTNPLSL
jgi:hypothetical protein